MFKDRKLALALAATTGLLTITTAGATDLTWGGFGSAYYGQALTNDLLPIGFSNNHASFTNFSLFGLSAGAKVDDHISAAAEIVANGSPLGAYPNFAVNINWAYATYTFDDANSVRGGRQRYPVFTASEFVNEHWELPFREIPEVVYRAAPFTAFDGFSVSHKMKSGLGDINIAIFGGNPIVDIASTSATATAQNMYGVRVNLEGDGWKIRAQASRANESLTLTANSSNYQANMQVFSAGYRYDKNNIVSWGEYLYRHSPDSSNGLYGRALDHALAGYFLIGYRIGDLMPRYTFAQAYSDIGFSPPGKSTTHTIGFNYNLAPKFVVKAEYEYDCVSAVGAGYDITQPAGASSTNGSAVYAGFDYAF